MTWEGWRMGLYATSTDIVHLSSAPPLWFAGRNVRAIHGILAFY